MSDHLKILSLHDHSVGDLLVWVMDERIPMQAYVSTSLEGDDELFFEWNDEDE